MTEAQQTTNAVPLDTWAVVELMGHVRLAGKLTEESHFGVALGRLDVPLGDGTFTTQFFGGSSVYRITPTTEEAARAVAHSSQPEPVHRWELPKPPDVSREDEDEEDRLYDADHEEDENEGEDDAESYEVADVEGAPW